MKNRKYNGYHRFRRISSVFSNLVTVSKTIKKMEQITHREQREKLLRQIEALEKQCRIEK